LAFIQNKFEIALTLRIDYLKRYKTETVDNYTPDVSDFRYAFLMYEN